MSQEGTIHVIALFVAAPGKEDELERVLTELIEPTRREAGCIRYELVRGLGRSAEFAFVEEWESVATLDAHAVSAHLKAMQAKVPGLLAAPASVERYRLVK